MKQPPKQTKVTRELLVARVEALQGGTAGLKAEFENNARAIQAIQQKQEELMRKILANEGATGESQFWLGQMGPQGVQEEVPQQEQTGG